MTNPVAIQTSNLVRTITLLYSMQDADTLQLATQLQEQRALQWQQTISRELARYGCTQTGRLPAGNDAATLSQMSLTDARSISNTYNRELQNQVQRLYNANPRGNRNYYFKNLEAWAAKREVYKAQQIALNTQTMTAEFARQRFRDENNVQGRYVFSGPAPVCVKCTRLKAMGIVGLAVVQQYGDSQHINCPHFWVDIRPRSSKLDCSTAWKGA